MTARKITGIKVNPVIGVEERQRIAISGTWLCRLDPENKGMAEGWAANKIKSDFPVDVPGCIQGCDTIGDGYPPSDGLRNSYLGTFWLENEVNIPDCGEGKLYWLKFGGIAPAAHIWINGVYVGYHNHVPVSVKFNVTDLLSKGNSNCITVAIVEQDLGFMGGLRFLELNWSGLFRDVEVEITSAVHMEEITVQLDGGGKGIEIAGKICNDTQTSIQITPGVQLAEWPREENFICQKRGNLLEIEAGAEKYFLIKVENINIKKWSCESPNLYGVYISLYHNEDIEDRCAERVGFRSFTSFGRHIYMNDQPFMIRGVGHEYFSPSISPPTDKEQIRNRFQAILDHGFNFCRYHTCIPTDEELGIADEMGIVLSSEIGLISNFHKTTPFEEGLVIFEEHILQTRNHPALGIYCLGNEGSQLMVDSALEREHAKVGYQLIKKYAPKHLAMIAFGLQGELPELSNDIESPHLWSHNFLWGYEGLSRIPWESLRMINWNKPCVIHEYGKFGVWPDEAEEQLYPRNGYLADFGWQGRQALQEIGLEEMEDKMITNSRKLSYICNRAIIEEARMQEEVNGYVMWTFFRTGSRNAGFIDDMGKHPDNDPRLYREGCNSPVAVLIDRNFSGRTLYGGSKSQIGVFVSNFGKSAIDDFKILWKLEDENNVLVSGKIAGDHLDNGKNAFVGNIDMMVPFIEKPKYTRLCVQLEHQGQIITDNQWFFWLFPNMNNRIEKDIVFDFKDKGFERTFKSKFASVVDIEDLDSIVRGCRSWKGSHVEDTLSKAKIKLLVTDHYDETARICIEKGISVLLIDNESFPSAWYQQPLLPDLGEKDPSLFYTSFRAGWDQGNLGTIIQANHLLDGFPHEGFCDLQFYHMIQGARSLKVEEIKKSIPALQDQVVIRSIAKVRTKVDDEVIVQDINAIKELKANRKRSMTAQDNAYLIKVTTQKGSCVISTLRLFDDPAGEYLLKNMMEMTL